MALNLEQLTQIVTYLSIFLVFQFIMTFHFYFQLRNKRGPPGPKGDRGHRGFKA
jgi:hypothetical protein